MAQFFRQGILVKLLTLIFKFGNLINIPILNPWPLINVLEEKYLWISSLAEEFSNFLLSMLIYDPSKRSTAQESLNHPWLREEIEEKFVNIHGLKCENNLKLEEIAYEEQIVN